MTATTTRHLIATSADAAKLFNTRAPKGTKTHYHLIVNHPLVVIDPATNVETDSHFPTGAYASLKLKDKAQALKLIAEMIDNSGLVANRNGRLVITCCEDYEAEHFKYRSFWIG